MPQHYSSYEEYVAARRSRRVWMTLGAIVLTVLLLAGGLAVMVRTLLNPPPMPMVSDFKELDRLYLNHLRTLREETGIDNAIIVYMEALESYPIERELLDQDIVRTTIDDGWTEDSESLLPIITEFQPLLAAIRKGNNIPNADNRILRHRYQAVSPDPFPFLMAGRIFFLEARYLENSGDLDGAIDCIDEAIFFQAALNSGEPSLVAGLTALHALSRSANIYRSFLLNPDLTERQIAQIYSSMSRARDRYQGILSALKGERIYIGFFLDGFEEYMQSLSSFRRKGMDIVLGRRLHATRPETEQMYQYGIELIQKSPRELDLTAAEVESERRKAAHVSIFLRNTKVLPDFVEVYRREYRGLANFRKLEIDIALARYRLLRGNYPDDLQQLIGVTIEALPEDPWSGNDFIYRLSDDGSYTLQSSEESTQEIDG